MAIEKPASWTGASGTEYAFYVFGPEPDVPPRSGLYIYARRNEAGAWVPVYVGHGDLSSLCTDRAVLRCIASKAPTHVHLRLNSLEDDCEVELQDLLAHYANAFAPEGCHTPIGSAVSPKAAKTKKGTKREKAKLERAAATTTTTQASAKKSPPKKAPAKNTAAKPTSKTAASKSVVKTASKAPRRPSR